MPLPPIPGLDDALAAVAERLRASTVEVRTTRGGRAAGHGSGVVWSTSRTSATVVTNAHVASTPHATITLPDGHTADARVVAHDPGRDLATLLVENVDAPALTVAAVGDSRLLRRGQLVVALGHPLGVANSFAVGVVHATDGAPFRRRGAGGSHLIAADIRLAPGNSGGPLANAAGEVVGINSMIANGLGVAISSAAVTSFLAAHAPRPQLGATLRPVTVALRGDGAPRTVGLLVLELARGGAAERSGLLPGDVLLAANGRRFESADDLLAILRDAGPGATLSLDVGRAGKRTIVLVTLGTLSSDTQYRRAA